VRVAVCATLTQPRTLPQKRSHMCPLMFSVHYIQCQYYCWLPSSMLFQTNVLMCSCALNSYISYSMCGSLSFFVRCSSFSVVVVVVVVSPFFGFFFSRLFTRAVRPGRWRERCWLRTEPCGASRAR